MNARDAARRLGGEVAGRDTILCPGPGHSPKDRSLSVKLDLGAQDGFVVYSYAGDDWRKCREYVLTALGLSARLGARGAYHLPIASTPRPTRNRRRTRGAQKIWRGTSPGASSVVESYLASRGLVCDRWPPSLRFHPSCPRPRDTAGNLQRPLPAMVALVEHIQHGAVAVHCTYLRPDGSAKADLPKNEQRACFGPLAGGAVRFGEPHPDLWLVIGEGIESTLSAALSCGLPGWAAISASGIEKLLLPFNSTHVVIAADNDLNGRGQRAAQRAGAHWHAEGRHVRIAVPPTAGTDFNDLIRRGASHAVA
jgi:putative DNA primase/helicase